MSSAEKRYGKKDASGSSSQPLTSTDSELGSQHRLPKIGTQSLHAMPDLVKEEHRASATTEVPYGDISIDDALSKLSTTREGISSSEADKRIEQYGPNALPEKKVNKCLVFLSFMNSPLPWVMEAAAIVAIVLSNGAQPWTCYNYPCGNPTFSLNDDLQHGINKPQPAWGEIQPAGVNIDFDAGSQCLYSCFGGAQGSVGDNVILDTDKTNLNPADFCTTWDATTSTVSPNDACAKMYPCPNAECGNFAPDWEDFVGIVFLLILNSCVGYYEEMQAGDAVSALMDQLAPECKCKRDGKWVTLEAKNLVPGDIITMKLGDIVPADSKLLEGPEMKVDQSGLTGESLPVTKKSGAEVYSGSTIKRGEIEALVYATGINTFFGKAANLVASTEEHGHLQEVLSSIASFCMGYIGFWIVMIIVVQTAAHEWYYRATVNLVLVVLIGGVPIAMPTVLSVTMALGVHNLAKKDAIVTRMTAVEELAGLDILCSDKTGTLTLNKLTIDDPACMPGFSATDVIFAAALCAKHDGDPDAIDQCIVGAVKDASQLKNFEVTDFIPFNPTDKRTEATLKNRADGKTFKTTKGAPQVIIDMAHNADEIRAEQESIVDDLALRGLRAIGVGRNDGDKWEFMGLIALFDPPRHDTKDTIEKALNLGVRVKMITGDQVQIGKETARRLGMGLNFHNAKIVRSDFVEGIPIADIIEDADGFGEVFPEDKYAVVNTLRHIKKGPRGGVHIVGMTGDGVNDAPALKVADVGIAVSDATDAARGAADIVLLTPGLGVIIDAIIGSREIFQRMKNYAIYACTTTIRIVTTFSLLAMIYEFSFPPFMVLVIAYLNDGTILTISKDFATASPTPDSWRLRDIFIHAFILGLYLTASSVIFYEIVTNTTFFEDKFGVDPIKYNKPFYGDDAVSVQVVSAIYLQVSITGQLLIFSTRSRDLFFMDLPSPWLMGAFVFAQMVATFIAVYADWPFATIGPMGWGWAGIVWVWSIIWYLGVDFIKILTRWIMDGDIKDSSVMKKKMFHFEMHGGFAHMGPKMSAHGNSRAFARASTRN